MALSILGKTTDLRTNTPVIYGQMPIVEYLALVGNDFDQFQIQRKRQHHKAYNRMKSDLKQGALLPPITLALDPDDVESVLPLLEPFKKSDVAEKISSLHLNILDGLQRTFILKDLLAEDVVFTPEHKVLLEFWLEDKLEHLIYRIIVLNAGQKPMSMRHQIDLLVSTLKTRFESQVAGLELFSERDGARRSRPRKFPLDKIAMGYHAFTTQSPEVKRENIVAQELVDSELLDSDESTLFATYNAFTKYLSFYSQLDDHLCRIYDGSVPSLPTGLSWLGSENTINAFFAAVSQLIRNPSLKERVDTTLAQIIAQLETQNTGDDPMGLFALQKVLEGFNSKKVNVGFATRKLLMNGFKEIFRDSAMLEIQKYWALAAE